MRRIFVILAVILSLNVSAQEQEKDIQKMQSGVSLEWDKPKGDNNVIRLDFVYKHLVIGGSYIIGSGGNDGDNVINKTKDSKGFDIHIGGNYRYFLGNGLFYVEGRLLAGYQCMTRETSVGKLTVNHISGFGNRLENEYEESEIWKTARESEGFNLSITPRIGIQKNGYSAYAGVGWNFLGSDKKFKNIEFDKKFEGYYFTVGLAKIF